MLRAERFAFWLAASCLLATGAWGQEEKLTPTGEPTTTFGTTVVNPSGLRGEIYYIRPGSWQLPDFEKLKPVGAIYTTSLNIPPQSFTKGFPGVTNRFEWFAIDYKGKFWIEDPGRYDFALRSDDGSRLYIDEKLMVGAAVLPGDCELRLTVKQGAASATESVHYSQDQ